MKKNLKKQVDANSHPIDLLQRKIESICDIIHGSNNIKEMNELVSAISDIGKNMDKVRKYINDLEIRINDLEDTVHELMYFPNNEN